MTALATRAPAEIRRWRVATGTAFALGGVTVTSWGPRLPALKAGLHLGDGALGLLVVGGTVASILGLVCSSAVHARLGARLGIVLLLALSNLGVVLIGTGAALASPALAELGFVLFGFGIGNVDVMVNVEGAAVEREGGRVVMPLLHACWSAGAVVGSAISAGAAALGLSPLAQFAGEGVLVVAVVALAARWIPRRVVIAERPAPLRDRVRGWLGAWRDLRLLLIGLVMLGVELGEGSANTWLTLGVAQGHGLAAPVAALYFTAFAVGETAFRAISGPIVQRIGRVAITRITTAAGAVGIALFVLGGPAWVVLLGCVLWAVGVSMGFPLGMSAAAESGANSAARVSVVASIGYLAGLAGPPVIGFLSQAAGLTQAFWLLAVFMVVALLAAGALRTPAYPILSTTSLFLVELDSISYALNPI